MHCQLKNLVKDEAAAHWAEDHHARPCHKMLFLHLQRERSRCGTTLCLFFFHEQALFLISSILIRNRPLCRGSLVHWQNCGILIAGHASHVGGINDRSECAFVVHLAVTAKTLAQSDSCINKIVDVFLYTKKYIVESSETGSGKVWVWSEPCWRNKRPFKSWRTTLFAAFPAIDSC